jgi:cytoplasmic iron level regulating protein YaaA (DUF328/UPF0246 family)
MRPAELSQNNYQQPGLIKYAQMLADYMAKLSSEDISTMMKVSQKLATKTQELLQGWSPDPKLQRPAIYSFLGDIYSGLRAGELSEEDLVYANGKLRILSGLYGILRPLDGIYPYRLEMGYKIKYQKFKNLYDFWGDKIAKTLPGNGQLVNLTAEEYSRVLSKFISGDRFITPKFLTINPKTNLPTFVTVHAKIARGAFARWMIINKIEDPVDLTRFNDLGYKFNEKISTPASPVYICDKFEGLGLSVRLT